jgi:hypothetical protein
VSFLAGDFLVYYKIANLVMYVINVNQISLRYSSVFCPNSVGFIVSVLWSRTALFCLN